jgi:hypothetical protein
MFKALYALTGITVCDMPAYIILHRWPPVMSRHYMNRFFGPKMIF